MNFIVFADDWGRHPSSCQHIFSIISKDRKVLWVNTVGMRVPSVGKGYDWKRSAEKILSWFKPVRKIHKNLYVFSPFMLPFQDNKLCDFFNMISVIVGIRILKLLLRLKQVITWTTVPNVDQFVGKLGEQLVIYNCTDDYSLWPGGNRELIVAQEQQVLRKSGLVLASSDSLVAHCKPYNENVLLYPHGVNVEHFSCVTREQCPEPLESISHPIIGFFGLLYEKINYDLLKKIAQTYSDVSIVLIGKQAVDLSSLQQIQNIHLIGAVDYEDLPKYAVHFDAGLMPYILDEEIKKSAPLKLKEYLALGKPIVSVAVKDVAVYKDLIYIAQDDDDFIAKVGSALSETDKARCKRRQKAVEKDTWNARVETVSKILEKDFALLL